MITFWLTIVVANAFTVVGWALDEGWPFAVSVALSASALAFLLFGGIR